MIAKLFEDCEIYYKHWAKFIQYLQLGYRQSSIHMVKNVWGINDNEALGELLVSRKLICSLDGFVWPVYLWYCFSDAKASYATSKSQ